jgi:hypothetical protein
MYQKTITIFLFVVFTVLAINKKKIFLELGFDSMDRKIIPEIVHFKDEVANILEVNIPNSLVLVDMGSTCKIIQISDDYELKIVETLPGPFGEEHQSDPSDNVLWAKNGRQFSAYDIVSKKTGTFVASHDGDEAILAMTLVEPIKKIFAVEVIHYAFKVAQSPVYYVLFDLLNDTIIYKSPLFDGSLAPFKNDTMLFIEAILDSNKNFIGQKWQKTDLHLSKYSDNELITQLNKNKIQISLEHSNRISLSKQIMIAQKRYITNSLYPFIECSIRWKPDFTDIKIEPLTIQIPAGYYLSEYMKFSGSGDWLKTTVEKKGDMNHVEMITFLQTNNAYPQGLSFPIIGGVTGTHTPGAFVNHTTLGPLYIEKDEKHPTVLLIYKLNDGLEYLKKIGIPGK